jgi:preprotein translocase subunit Sss1
MTDLVRDLGIGIGTQLVSRVGIIEHMSESVKYIYDEGKNQGRYGFRRLPDILLSGSLFLTFLLGWQPALATFSVGILFTGITQGILADFVKIKAPSLVRAGNALGGDNCSGHFPGVTWSRIATIFNNPRDLTEGAVPSYYMTVMGYIFAFVMSQTFIFKDELSMRPSTDEWMKVFSVVVGIGITALGIFRVVIGCEPWWASILSGLLGILLGFTFIGIAVWLFGRRSVNVLHLPLLTQRIPDGKPIYVCAS